MAKKNKDINAVLTKAETMFQRGNYPLALKEFEKVQKKLNREDIAEKIKICRKEADIVKAKNLIKKAMKSVNKNNLIDAVRCFEQANDITREDWVSKKINALKTEIECRSANSAAIKAEQAGDFQKMAELYKKAYDANPDQELLLKRAGCLVKAGEYAAAITVFRQLSVDDPVMKYNYGFALAKTGRYTECLKVWSDLDHSSHLFPDQKKHICLLAAADLFNRFETDKDFSLVFKDSGFLLHIAKDHLPPNIVKSVKDLQSYCKYAWIEQLWETGDYETIRELLDRSDSLTTPNFPALQAKVYFKLAEKNNDYIERLVMLWVTAIFSREISSGFSKNADEKERIQKTLIEAVEALIKKCPDFETQQKALVCLNIEKQLIQDLMNLAGDSREIADLICSPGYAIHFKRSNDLLNLIRKHKNYFKSVEHYLETGGYFSQAGECLYLVKNNRIESAMSVLENLPSEAKADEFIHYVSMIVNYEFGMYCIENREKKFIHYFNSTPALFDISPDMEKKFTDEVTATEASDRLRPYEDVLTHIHKQRQSTLIKETLSLVMTRRAISMYNRNQLTVTALRAIVHKALLLFPENELARETLVHASINYEISALYKAFSKNKINKASRIAQETEFSEVRDQYFKFVEDIVNQIGESQEPREIKMMNLEDIYSWSTTVDQHHPLLDDIHSKLHYLEEVAN